MNSALPMTKPIIKLKTETLGMQQKHNQPTKAKNPNKYAKKK